MSEAFKTSITKLEKTYLNHKLKINSNYLDLLQTKSPSALDVICTQGEDRIEILEELIEYLYLENERNNKD